MADENVDPGAAALPPSKPLSFDDALRWTQQHSSLPPANSLKTLDPANLAKVVECANFAGFLPTLWPAAFGTRPRPPPPSATTRATSPHFTSFALRCTPDESDISTKPARLEAATLALVRQLDSGCLPDGVAKKSTEWFIGELQVLSARQLVRVLEGILAGLSAALELPPASPRAYHLLPTILAHCSVVDAAAGLTTAQGRPLPDGHAIKSYALSILKAAPWAAGALVPLATMLRDLALPAPSRAMLVKKLLARLGELDPNQLPALVYQLLLLADADSKPEARAFLVLLGPSLAR